MPRIGARFYQALDTQQLRADDLQDQLNRMADLGRMCRTIIKLGQINERPSCRNDTQWAETGDRYLLKLFRDYLFHQSTEAGRPWLDPGHVVTAVRKFDAGSPQKICLLSRDDQNVLIVSYAELKRCFDTSYAELTMS